MIIGMDSLMRKLQSMGGNVLGALERGVKQTVEVAAGDARALAPVSKYSQADRARGAKSLRQSISTKTEKEFNAIVGKVIASAYHAMYVEFGTGPIGRAIHAGISPNVSPTYTTRRSWVYPIIIKGEEEFRTTSGRPARPFMYPAASQNKFAFKHLIVNAITAEIQKIASRR